MDIIHLKLYVWADISLGDILGSQKSTGGYIIFLGNTPVYWKSKRQFIITLSTIEAEFINLTPAGLSAMWIDRLTQELGLPS